MTEKFKRTPISFILIAINIIVFIITKIIMITSGISLEQSYNLYIHGGLGLSLHSVFAILLSGFTHFTIIHIFFNMLFLYYMGPVIEIMIKRRYFILLYFGTLFISGLAVVLFTSNLSITIGASGALYGLLGFLIVYYFLNQSNLKRFIKIDALIVLVAINFLISFIVPDLSKIGHIGGFISGCLLAFIIDFFQNKRLKRKYKKEKVFKNI